MIDPFRNCVHCQHFKKHKDLKIKTKSGKIIDGGFCINIEVRPNIVSYDYKCDWRAIKKPFKPANFIEMTRFESMNVDS